LLAARRLPLTALQFGAVGRRARDYTRYWTVASGREGVWGDGHAQQSHQPMHSFHLLGGRRGAVGNRSLAARRDARHAIADRTAAGASPWPRSRPSPSVAATSCDPASAEVHWTDCADGAGRKAPGRRERNTAITNRCPQEADRAAAKLRQEINREDHHPCRTDRELATVQPDAGGPEPTRPCAAAAATSAPGPAPTLTAPRATRQCVGSAGRDT
jgi:hypothetical protein